MMIIYTLLGLVVAGGSAFAGYYYATSLSNIELMDKDMVLRSMREYASNLEADRNALKSELELSNQKISDLQAELAMNKIEAAVKASSQKQQKAPAKKAAKKSYKKSA